MGVWGAPGSRARIRSALGKGYGAEAGGAVLSKCSWSAVVPVSPPAPHAGVAGLSSSPREQQGSTEEHEVRRIGALMGADGKLSTATGHKRVGSSR